MSVIPNAKTQSVSMSEASPTDFIDRLNTILIAAERQEREEKVSMTPFKVTLTLRQLIERYSVSLGQNSASLLSAVVTLLTKGKIRMEFSTYWERLTLLKQDEILSQADAIRLFSSYTSGRVEPTPNARFATQQLLIQIPRRKAY